MSLVAAFVAGGALGARHALETDHLAAVTTLVEGDTVESGSSSDGANSESDAHAHPGLVGASWGIGHTVPIAALGVAFLLLGIRLPESVTRLFEVGVGIVLVYLGARMLADVVGLQEHTHGTRSIHTHVRIGRFSVGGGHAHLSGDSLVVGALHGVAGSGALVIALVSTAPDLPTAAAFLTAFGLCSVVTMAAVSALWGRTLSTGFDRALRGVAGVVGVAAGLLLVVEQVGAVPF
ncbi:high-affinity nickel-transporter protein [Haloplanus salilacus]|uniref:high-affinity nickel-transporter protein n=1 Tax=Haloplanus salilacus TaxID=2949994 RepID=UPI0030CC97B7